MIPDLNRLEIERIRNLVTGFGWKMTEERVTEDKILVTMEKPVVAPTEVSKEGAD